MIRPIDIRLNAAHPELPLSEAFTFTGSPSTVLIRNVPPNCGRWAITAVNVAATFPDNSTTTRAAVQSANGVWVATLPATATSGRTASGLRIMADGIDENGEAVTGYILGVADFAVASLAVTPAPAPGETSYQMLYFDTIPSVLRKGDVTKIDGVLKFYDGTAWLPFTNIDPAQFVPTSRTINNKALTDNVTLSGSDIPTTAATDSPTLANSISTLNDTKASKAEAEALRTGKLDNNVQTAYGTASLSFVSEQDEPLLRIMGAAEDYIGIGPGGIRFYIPGQQLARMTLPLASGTLALLSNTMRFSTAVPYAVGDVVFYNGAFYCCTTAHTAGAWNALHFAEVIGGLSTGTPTAPTPEAGDSTTKIATTAFVQAAVEGATPNLDYVMRVDPETGGIYYTTPNTNA